MCVYIAWSGAGASAGPITKATGEPGALLNEAEGEPCELRGGISVDVC